MRGWRRPIGKKSINRGRGVGGRGKREVRRRFLIWRMEDIGGTGGGEQEGKKSPCKRLGVRQKTQRGGTPTRYVQNRRRTAVDKLTGCIVGGGRGCHSCSNGNGDSNRGADNDGRGMEGSSWNTIGGEDTPDVSTCLSLCQGGRKRKKTIIINSKRHC